MYLVFHRVYFVFFKQKTAYEMRISDWSSDVCSSDLLDFLAQYLQLRHAAERPEVLSTSTQQAFARLADAGVLEEAQTARLIEATRFLRQVQEALRLTVGPAFAADTLPPTLQAALTASVDRKRAV